MMHGQRNIKFARQIGKDSTTVTFRRVQRVEFCTGRKWVCLWSSICFYIRKCSWNPNSNSPEPDRAQHDRPTASVIAQKYSSVTFISLLFQSRKKIGTLFKNIVFYLSFLFLFLKSPPILKCRHELFCLKDVSSRLLINVGIYQSNSTASGPTIP